MPPQDTVSDPQGRGFSTSSNQGSTPSWISYAAPAGRPTRFEAKIEAFRASFADSGSQSGLGLQIVP